MGGDSGGDGSGGDVAKRWSQEGAGFGSLASGGAPAAGVGGAAAGAGAGAGVDAGGASGNLLEGNATFNNATSWWGRFTGDTSSDQKIFDNVAQNEALTKGDAKFIDYQGRSVGVSDREGFRSRPTPGSLSANIASGPSKFSLGPIGLLATVAGAPWAVSLLASGADKVLGTPNILSVSKESGGVTVGSDLLKTTPEAPRVVSMDEEKPWGDRVWSAPEQALTLTPPPPGQDTPGAVTVDESQLGGQTAKDLLNIPGKFLTDLTAILTGKGVKTTADKFVTDEGDYYGNEPQYFTTESEKRKRILKQPNLITTSSLALSEELEDPLAETRRRMRSGASLLSSGYGGFG